jgi:hypothetical protein
MPSITIDLRTKSAFLCLPASESVEINNRLGMSGHCGTQAAKGDGNGLENFWFLEIKIKN